MILLRLNDSASRSQMICDNSVQIVTGDPIARPLRPFDPTTRADVAGRPRHVARGATIAHLWTFGRNHRVVAFTDSAVSADSDTAGQARALTHDSHLPSGERVVDVRRIGGHRASGRNLPSIPCRDPGSDHARASRGRNWHGWPYRDDSQHDSDPPQFFGDGIARMRVAVARLPDCRADC